MTSGCLFVCLFVVVVVVVVVLDEKVMGLLNQMRI